MPAITRRYLFSGHESFFCKPLWLKKGYDALLAGVDFSSPEAVCTLGVGKNMVSSIRYWLKAFGIIESSIPSSWASAIFADYGMDPFLEDEGTLWLLHYFLVTKRVASLYHLVFLDFQREKKEFDRDQLQSFIYRKCLDPGQKNVYNENTVRKDINVFLHSYLAPEKAKSNEDYLALFQDLGILRQTSGDRFSFSELDESHLPADILLYAMLDYKGQDRTVSLDGLQDLALIFCMPLSALVELIKAVVARYPDEISYTDNSGLKNVQFIREPKAASVLNNYYSSK